MFLKLYLPLITFALITTPPSLQATQKEVLPSINGFDPKNCELYMNRLTIRAQMSVNSDKLHKWVDQVLDLLPFLCIRESE